MTSKEYKDNIRTFTTDFLDYYRLNELDLEISDWNFSDYSLYNLNICKLNTFSLRYLTFNINEYKDRLVSFLQNITTEYVCSKSPALITVSSINRRGESVKTMYFDLKGFSNTRFEEPIERIELTIIRK